MQKINLMDKYPIYTKEVLKANTKFKNVWEFVEVLKQKVESDPIGIFIWVFDHFKHTSKIGWEIMEWIIAWEIFIFCFWKKIQNTQVMAIRPRNISIVELKDKFVISFLEAPMEKINQKMIDWILEF